MRDNSSPIGGIHVYGGSDRNALLLFLTLQHLGPEVKWVDGGKPLFKVSTHLVSTVYTQVSFFAPDSSAPYHCIISFVFSVCALHSNKGFVSLCVSGSAFAQFFPLLSKHCIRRPGVRRRAGQIPEGKSVTAKFKGSN